MTLIELEEKIKVVANGLEVRTNTEHYICSVNRALRRLYNDRRFEKTVRLAAYALNPVLYQKKISCKNGELHEYPLNGRAYSMRVHGNGRIQIVDGNLIDVIPIDSPYESKVIKGFLSTGGKISFWGSFSFDIYDLAVFDQIYSQHIEDIPEYGPKLVFDLRNIFGDFMAFSSPVTDSDGNVLVNCRQHNGKVEIDSTYHGEILVTYRRMPKEVENLEKNVDFNNQLVDITDEYLYPFIWLFAATYLFFEDEELSQIYMDKYNRFIEKIEISSYDRIESAYHDTNGWA